MKWPRIDWLEVLAWVAVGWVMLFAGRVEPAPLTEQLEQAVCGKPCAGLKAAQIGDVILMRADLDMADPLNASILLHELVHYVQWAKFGPAKDCPDYRDREIQAYEIQFAALARIGVRAPPAPLPRCT